MRRQARVDRRCSTYADCVVPERHPDRFHHCVVIDGPALLGLPHPAGDGVALGNRGRGACRGARRWDWEASFGRESSASASRRHGVFSRTRRSLYQNRARESSFDAFLKALLAECSVDSGGNFPRLRCRKIANLGGFRILWFQKSMGGPLCNTHAIGSRSRSLE